MSGFWNINTFIKLPVDANKPILDTSSFHLIMKRIPLTTIETSLNEMERNETKNSCNWMLWIKHCNPAIMRKTLKSSKHCFQSITKMEWVNVFREIQSEITKSELRWNHSKQHIFYNLNWFSLVNEICVFRR